MFAHAKYPNPPMQALLPRFWRLIVKGKGSADALDNEQKRGSLRAWAG
jgi:hypothetical protein